MSTAAAMTDTFFAVFSVPIEGKHGHLAISGTVGEPTPGFLPHLAKLKHQPGPATTLHLALIEVKPTGPEPQHTVEQNVSLVLSLQKNPYKEVAIHRGNKIIDTVEVTDLVSPFK